MSTPNVFNAQKGTVLLYVSKDHNQSQQMATLLQFLHLKLQDPEEKSYLYYSSEDRWVRLQWHLKHKDQPKPQWEPTRWQCRAIYYETDTKTQPQWDAMMKSVRPGDTIVTTSLLNLGTTPEAVISKRNACATEVSDKQASRPHLIILDYSQDLRKEDPMYIFHMTVRSRLTTADQCVERMAGVIHKV